MKKPASYQPVTIGIVVRNAKATIDDCLASIINCDYEKHKLEIIVVDGESTDGTVGILRKYAMIAEQKRIRFKILSDKRRGLGFARQLVVENSSFDYICWVDSDTVITPNLCKLQMAFVEEKPLAGIVVPLVLSRGRSFIERLQEYVWLMPMVSAVKTKRTPYITMQGAITPVRALKAVNGFDITIKGAGEDNDIVSRLKLKNYAVLVNGKAFVYHLMPKSYSCLLRHIAWYGHTEPEKRTKILIKECLFRFSLYIKLTLLTARTFRDVACVLVPFHVILLNTVWFLSHFTSIRENC
ncbi:MAG: glycosyltransferase [Candidatus Bathyarchaeia archaeon]|jgi:glycosyltransferase involved in cell wall biosynthesis